MFRKRFNTTLKLNNEVNSNIAEKLMAHKRGLDGTYLQPTMEECFAEFVKAIPELTIDPANRQQIEIAKQKKEITELGKKNLEIQKLKKTQDETSTRIDDLAEDVASKISSKLDEGQKLKDSDMEMWAKMVGVHMSADPKFAKKMQGVLKEHGLT